MSESGPQLQLESLVRENIPWAMRLAIRLTGDVHDAEDAVQDALVRITKSVESFRGESSFRTWFARIIVNVVRSRHSARQSPTVGLPDDAIATTPSAAEQLDASERADQITRCIGNLPPRQREVLVLSTYESMSPQQIADVLSVSAQNVYSNLNAARTRLKQQLHPHLSESEIL